MADYDVGVLELTTPAATAPLAQCRPVVSVRNNGLHDAVASGYLRIYSAGLLVFETEVYSDTIGPGETRPCSAIDYWTPPAEGKYVVQGYISSPLDQIEPNNNLWPTTVVIAGVEPPPPTPIPLHASQHESGGADELSLEGLPGRAADQQRPINHASFHEFGGIDPVNVQDMPGLLMEGQKPLPHAASHKIGGSDLLSVLALPDATSLERLANKGQPLGYPGLDNVAHVIKSHLAEIPTPTPNAGDALTFGSGWSRANPLWHAYQHQPTGDDELDVTDLHGVLADPQRAANLEFATSGILVGPGGGEVNICILQIPAVWANDTLGIIMRIWGILTTNGAPAAFLLIRMKFLGLTLAYTMIDASVPQTRTLDIEGSLTHIGNMRARSRYKLTLWDAAAAAHQIAIDASNTDRPYTAEPLTLGFTAEFDGAHLSDTLAINGTHAFGTGTPS